MSTPTEAGESLPGEQVPNAIFGAMLGIGVAASNDLSEQPADLVAAFVEIGVFVIIVLALTVAARAAALELSHCRWLRGIVLGLCPIALLTMFAYQQRAFITYGDVMVLSVLALWWASYAVLGAMALIQRLRA